MQLTLACKHTYLYLISDLELGGINAIEKIAYTLLYMMGNDPGHFLATFFCEMFRMFVSKINLDLTPWYTNLLCILSQLIDPIIISL